MIGSYDRVLLLSIACVILLFGWPTIYRYDTLSYPEREVLVKINRVTGATQLLDMWEWQHVSSAHLSRTEHTAVTEPRSALTEEEEVRHQAIIAIYRAIEQQHSSQEQLTKEEKEARDRAIIAIYKAIEQ